MPLTEYKIRVMRQLAHQVAGNRSRVRIFGSRRDDAAHVGDLNLMLGAPAPVDNPALIAVRSAALVSRVTHSRELEVRLSPPKLTCPAIHEIASKHGGRNDGGTENRTSPAISRSGREHGMRSTSRLQTCAVQTIHAFVSKLNAATKAE